jgi:predicted RNA-binding Zn-ribbon protein involved in translation (DUF1610 family)
MNITKHSKTLGALIAAVFAITLASEAQAGPGPQQVFTPVKTMKQAQSLRPGSRIAISCGNCGGITTYTVDEGRSYLKGYTCPSCKRVYRVMPGGGGRAVDQFTLADKYGQIAHLSTGGKR